MKTKVILINAVVACTVALAGCSTTNMMASGDGVSTSKHQLNATNPEQVKIYHSIKDIPKHHTVIGRVVAQSYNMVGIPVSQAAIMMELKKQAAALGANGISHISSGLTQTTAEAIVVK